LSVLKLNYEDVSIPALNSRPAEDPDHITFTHRTIKATQQLLIGEKMANRNETAISKDVLIGKSNLQMNNCKNKHDSVQTGQMQVHDRQAANWKFCNRIFYFQMNVSRRYYEFILTFCGQLVTYNHHKW